MAIALHKSAVVETAGVRTVEMVFIDGPTLEQAPQILSFRLQVSLDDGHDRIREAYLEALQHARDTVDAEIRRLEQG